MEIKKILKIMEGDISMVKQNSSKLILILIMTMFNKIQK
jgi:hypothetical protein